MAARLARRTGDVYATVDLDDLLREYARNDSRCSRPLYRRAFSPDAATEAAATALCLDWRRRAAPTPEAHRGGA